MNTSFVMKTQVGNGEEIGEGQHDSDLVNFSTHP